MAGCGLSYGVEDSDPFGNLCGTLRICSGLSPRVYAARELLLPHQGLHIGEFTHASCLDFLEGFASSLLQLAHSRLYLKRPQLVSAANCCGIPPQRSWTFFRNSSFPQIGRRGTDDIYKAKDRKVTSRKR